ncbi:hypothetical protein ABBQ38_012507 [Trebouxia sp. C0009 RCD-2024]
MLPVHTHRERKRLEAEALVRFQREEEEARVAAEAAAAAERRRREEAREEARRKKAEEERTRQEAAARAAAEAAAKAEAARQAEAAAQQAWREENQRRKAEAAARQLAAEQEAARQAAAKAAAEMAAAERRAAEAAAARKAAAERAAAEKAAAEAAAREAARKQAEEERAAAEQVRLLAAKMAAEKLAAQQRAEAEERAQAERDARRKAELRAQRVALAQAMQERRAAKLAAKKEQQEKAKAARAASMAAKAAARAAEAEAAAQHGGYVHLTSDDDFLNPRLGPPMQPLHLPRQPLQPEQYRHSAGGAGPSRGSNGLAQHAQHGQGAAEADDGAKQPASRNGFQIYHPHGHNGQLVGGERHPEGSERQMWGANGDTGQDLRRESGSTHRYPHGTTSDMLRGGQLQSGGWPTGATLYSGSGLQNSLELNSMQVSASHGQLHPVELGCRHHASSLSHDQGATAEGSWQVHARLSHSAGSRQLPQQLPASESESRRPDSEEADDKFDWGAWMSPEGDHTAIAGRLQRPRRPPKRPYPLPDPTKPRLKKHHSSKGSSQHQRRLTDRLLRQESGSTSSGQFSQEWPHGPVQHAHKPRPSSAIPGRSCASHRGAKGKSKGRRALEEVGCIRAAPYQGEAFMRARMDVQQQQGVVPGNQAPADADHGHQAMPHTVRVVTGKQRGHRSAVRDLSRDEAVTDASKWGLLKGRTQDLRFGRSRVHAWGLFAKQDIEPEEFIIEYVGQTIRTSLLDVREKAYERSGLGSSYLFRIDESWAVDATRQGGLARFINHSCDPNCYTKIITVEGHKHIVIYSKHHIHAGEELSYDYKFEYELTEEPIKCTCGAVNCRGRLN